MEWLTLLALGVAAGAISFTITKTHITEPIRTHLKLRQWDMLHYLFSCPYCMSHWVSLGLVIFAGPGLLHWAIETMVLVGLAGFVSGGLMRAFYIQEQENAELQRQLNELIELVEQVSAPAESDVDSRMPSMARAS
jgi:hypothetical protein